MPENHSISGDDWEEYDGVSIMWVRFVEDMQAMVADPAFAPVLEDGEQFLDGTDEADRDLRRGVFTARCGSAVTFGRVGSRFAFSRQNCRTGAPDRAVCGQ